MRKFLLLFCVLCIAFSCSSNYSASSQTTIKIIDNTNITSPDITISRDEYDQIMTFRPFARDIAFYLKAHSKSIIVTHYSLKCKNIELWIANGYYGFDLDSPFNIKFNELEKHYFWEVYQKYMYSKRIYNYEDAKILIKN